MQEKDKNVSTVKFLTVYGTKISSNEHYNPEDDTTDQRAPVNNPSELWDTFMMDDEMRAEIAASLEDENIDDFDDDVYDYEDRSDLGEDIALAQSLDLKASQRRLANSKARKEAEEKVDDESDAE